MLPILGKGCFSYCIIFVMDDKEKAQKSARRRASRNHQGPNHWHVERRSNVIICGNCEAKIPVWKDPQYCPECEEGKS